MYVLVVNAGSSSLKYQLLDTTTENVLAKGLCERIGIDGLIEHKKEDGSKSVREIPMPNHAVAMKIVVDTLTDAELGCIKDMSEIDAIGHRAVHGGVYFSQNTLIGENTITTASGEVLTYTHTMVVEATAYTKTDAGCDDWTATGTLARYGAIAVDPSVIPYGTRMYIVSNDGQVIYGYATAEDCGGAINGTRVDLYYDTYDECIQFGRRDCTIYFLD